MPSTPNPIRAALLTAILVSAAALGGPRNSEAQVASSSPDVLSALLVEVRGLRSAMEQMASAGPRVQLALGRLQLQEQRVNTLVRRLEDARTSLAQARTGLEELTGRMTEHERLSRESSDPEIRQAVEAELKQLKTAVARGTLESAATAGRGGDAVAGHLRRTGALVRTQSAARGTRTGAHASEIEFC